MRLTSLLLFVIQTAQLFSQDSSRLRIYPIPKIVVPFFDFENIENTFSLLPINGGLYCPESQSWYKIPDEKKYISVSYNAIDSMVSYSILSDNSSYILINKLRTNSEKIEDSIQLPSMGLYFVKQLNKDTLLYGGLTKGNYSIFQITNKNVTLLFSYKGPIDNIQIRSSNSFFFQVGKKIYYFHKGYKPYCIFSSQNWIDGFAFDDKMNLYISRMQGVFKLTHGTASLVIPYIHGLLKINGNDLFILSLQESEFVRLHL